MNDAEAAAHIATVLRALDRNSFGPAAVAADRALRAAGKAGLLRDMIAARDARAKGGALSPAEAHAILARCKIAPGTDFHALRAIQVYALLREANARRYRAPRDANGSRARYFHAYVERRISASL